MATNSTIMLKYPQHRINGATAPTANGPWRPQSNSTGFGVRLTQGSGPVTAVFQTASTTEAAAGTWTTQQSVTTSTPGIYNEFMVDSTAHWARVVVTACPQGSSVDVYTSEAAVINGSQAAAQATALTVPSRNPKLAAAMGAALQANPLNAELSTMCTVTGGLWAADLANALQMSTQQSKFLTRGGTFVSDGNAANYPLKSASVASSNVGFGTIYSTCNEVAFRTTAAQVMMKLYVGGGSAANSALRITVNAQTLRGTNLPGKQASKILTLTAQAAGVYNFVQLDFSSFGGAGIEREVRFEWDEGVTGGNLSYSAGLLWAPIESKPQVCFFGDSFFAAGAGPSAASPTYMLNNLGMKAAALLGWSPTCSAVGGTGYTNNGGSNYAFTNTNRIADMSSRTYDAFVIAGGTNDGGSTAAAITAAALTTFQAARAASATALIIVCGCWNGQLVTAPTTQTQVENAVYAAFVAFADVNSMFIPVTTDPAGAWITAGNVAIYIDPDNTHPLATIGEWYFAEKLAEAVRAKFRGA